LGLQTPGCAALLCASLIPPNSPQVAVPSAAPTACLLGRLFDYRQSLRTCKMGKSAKLYKRPTRKEKEAAVAPGSAGPSLSGSRGGGGAGKAGKKTKGALLCRMPCQRAGCPADLTR
jgi:hypothetical protein